MKQAFGSIVGRISRVVTTTLNRTHPLILSFSFRTLVYVPIMKSFVPIQALFWPLATAAVIRQVADDCKVLPGDPGWPSADVWDNFNQTIGGKLIATVPLGAICHPGGFGTAVHDVEACETLRSEWDLPAA